jgi:hypothetical protein
VKEMNTLKQEQVVEWIKAQEDGEIICVQKVSIRDNRGPDLCLKAGGTIYYFEAIAFSDNNRGKNQSDFWKAFSQAIARLNPESSWGIPEKVVIALPHRFKEGWRPRVSNLGKSVWLRIGNAFPELEIWFVSESMIEKYSWNAAFCAGL